MLAEKWQEAVDLILGGSKEDQEREEWRRIWMETKDPKQTMAKINHRSFLEKTVLKGLLRKGETDYLGAIQMVSSILFNKEKNILC